MQTSFLVHEFEHTNTDEAVAVAGNVVMSFFFLLQKMRVRYFFY
jgi:hypothetical protein